METKFLTIDCQLMFDILQPTSLIPYEREEKKIEILKKPAVIIPLPGNPKTPLPKIKKKVDTPLPFEQWKMPVQEDGYIKGSKADLW